MPKPIDFYFDFSSPYAYLMARDLTHLAQRHSRELNWHPILLGVVFKQTGRTPPIDGSTRGQYLRHDIERTARRKGLKFQWPAAFPFNSVAAVRAYYAIQQQSTKRAVHFAQALLDCMFLDGLALDDELIISLAERFDIDRAGLTEQLSDPTLKALAKTQVNAAIERGVFGSPMVFVGDEPFWGNDRLDDIAHWLEADGF